MFYFKNLKEWQQTSFVILTNQILFLISSFYFFKYWYLAIISMYFVGMCWEVALHRYFAHNSYKAIPNRIPLLCIMSFIIGQGSILSWSNVHKHHHMYADTPNDPHSPFYVPIWRIMTSIFPNKCEKIYIRELLKTSYRKYLVFENKWYWLMWIGLWVGSFLISPKLFFFFVSGSALWWWGVVAVNIFSHKLLLGHRPNPNKVATNSKIINLFTGMGNHHNHHADPKNYTERVDKEFFIYEYPIKWFFMEKGEKKL